MTADNTNDVFEAELCRAQVQRSVARRFFCDQHSFMGREEPDDDRAEPALKEGKGAS